MFSRAVVLSFVLIFAFGPGVSANAQGAEASTGSESPDIADQPLLLTCTGGAQPGKIHILPRNVTAHMAAGRPIRRQIPFPYLLTARLRSDCCQARIR